MEAKIMDVLRRMQLILDEVQLRELKEVLQMTFTGCRVIQETEAAGCRQELGSGSGRVSDE